MPTIDLKWALLLSIVLAILGALAGAGSQFTDLGFSAPTVKAILAGFGLLLAIGNAINSVFIAFGMTNAGRIASVQNVPLAERASALVDNTAVAKLVLTDQQLADSIQSDKVVGPSGK
jgi:hypothetical protein